MSFEIGDTVKDIKIKVGELQCGFIADLDNFTLRQNDWICYGEDRVNFIRSKSLIVEKYRKIEKYEIKLNFL